ncbi:hypothetical protein D3C87_1455620 [compost metagenome]
MGNSAVTHNAPSFNCGRNSVPKKVAEKKTATKIVIEAISVFTLCLKVHANPLLTILSQKFTNGLFFSFTFLFNRICDKTGTNVKVKSKAPINAKPKV